MLNLNCLLRAIACLCGLLVLFAVANDSLAFDVILDPGHSAQRYGTLSCSGKKEYEYNNQLLMAVFPYLADQKIYVDVTRDPEEEITLMQRAEKSEGKKLFISLHHDSAQEQFITRVGGYPCSRKARGYSIFVSKKNPYFERSLSCARVLGEALRGAGLVPSTHHGEPISGENRTLLDAQLGIYLYDDLVVLKKSKCPALLLEAGVIIHPDEDKLVQTLDYKRSIANGIAQAIRYAQEHF
ncbi:MAG: N-acetylmuramoyl-L-alanine amidase [Desulfovibrio sp.]|nr:N-acetylmuramoyl-L-alanine amidase [Desulfovibrio sp.]